MKKKPEGSEEETLVEARAHFLPENAEVKGDEIWQDHSKRCVKKEPVWPGIFVYANYPQVSFHT